MLKIPQSKNSFPKTQEVPVLGDQCGKWGKYNGHKDTLKIGADSGIILSMQCTGCGLPPTAAAAAPALTTAVSTSDSWFRHLLPHLSKIWDPSAMLATMALPLWSSLMSVLCAKMAVLPFLIFNTGTMVTLRYEFK